MGIVKLLQNRVYVPLYLRELLDVEDKDELVWKVLQVGDMKLVVLEKNALRGIRVIKTKKKPTTKEGDDE